MLRKKSDPMNTTNDLENQNKLLKKVIEGLCATNTRDARSIGRLSFRQIKNEKIIWNMKSRKIHFEKYELIENSRAHMLCRKKLCFDYIIA